MRRIYLLLLFLIPLSLLAACSSDDEIAIATLEISKTTVDFKSEASEQSLTITTNAVAWTAQSDKSWCRPSIVGKLLKISVDQSDERLVREATVSVTADGLSKTIRVRQLGYEAAILIDQQAFEVPAVGAQIKFAVTTNVEVEPILSDWIVEAPKTRSAEMVTTDYCYSVRASILDNKRQGTIVFTEKLPEDATENDVPVSATVSVTQHGLNEYNADTGEDIKGDIKLKVKDGTASSFQGGGEIEKSFDGDYSSIYHSSWNNSGSNYFPITLTYNLEEVSDVDYLVYYPRTDGANGKFKEVEIQYSEDGSAFTPLADKDFLGSASATKVLFDAPVRAKSFRFIVKTGAGDGQGFASCAEMEFYAKNPEAFDYSTLFADETCSELKAGITEADIEKCEFPFFKNLAYYMIKGKYEPEFRVGEFKAYPNPDIQSGTHKTNPYSLLDNPTGISVKANENLIVLVGDTHGYDISLKVQNLDAPESDGFGGVTYPLSRGTNKLTISEKGLVYVMYHTRTLDDAAALPVKIHFASGTVNGYFDSQKHEGRWNELLGKATDKYFDVVGKYAHMTFETNDYRKYAANNGNELIDLYDQIALNEMQLLGLEKYDKMFRNRMYLNVMYQSYMYATSYHTAYNQMTMSDICNPSKLKTSACWGPAHEIGHCNQTRLGVMWIGMTEVTNNIMSEYIQTTIFGQDSRIQTEDMGDVYRNRYSKAWNGIIVAGSSHADFSNIGDDANDVFCKLVPFWQLELYFGKVLGRTPLQQSDKGGFYPDVYEYARNKDYTGMTDGDIQLDFVYNCCLSAKMNLLDFFEKWGFLTPVNKKIEDYDTRTLTVTPDMVDALRHKVNGLGYSKPDVALEYISDNSFELYKSRASVVAGSHATHTAKSFTEGKTEAIGEAITIQGWKNVVAYEVKDADGKLIFVCSGETTPSSTHTFILPLSWKEGFKLYAVSATGDRTEVTMN